MCSILLTPNEIQADNSEFGVYLQSPIKLNPSLEWEAAVIDAYIPYSIDVTKTTTTTTKSKEQYWFRYILEKGPRTDTLNDYNSYEKFYYNPIEHYSHAESFIITKLMKLKERKYIMENSLNSITHQQYKWLLKMITW